MGLKSIEHYFVYAKDLEASRQFYETVLATRQAETKYVRTYLQNCDITYRQELSCTAANS